MSKQNCLLGHVRLDNADIEPLINCISDAEGVEIVADREMSGVWIHSKGYETEFRILLLSGYSLTVSRVQFQKRHQGTMTKCLGILEDMAKNFDVPKIVIQSVLTQEMANWCVKNGFVPNTFATFMVDGILIGDYELILQ